MPSVKATPVLNYRDSADDRRAAEEVAGGRFKRAAITAFIAVAALVVPVAFVLLAFKIMSAW